MAGLATAVQHLLQAARAGRRYGSAEEHVRSAVSWLAAAQAAAGGGGFAHSFHLFRGWQKPYPETTGYILPSLRRAAARFPIAEATALIDRAARWLASVQQKDGSFTDLAAQPQVFDTGQVVHGWNDLAEHMPHLVDPERHLRAARWIADQQERDGRFERHTWRGARSYYVRVGAALIGAGRRFGDAALIDAGLRNVSWTLAQQRQNGFFDRMGFDASPPFLHTIVYVIEGLLDAFDMTGKDEFIEAALRLAAPLLPSAERGSLPRSRYRPDFTPVDRELCLPGLAQWAAQCFRLVALGHAAYASAGRAALDALKRHQLRSHNPGLDGGLFGSAPFWGHYLRWSVPNWGVKYLIDAFLAGA
jgi:hypothetical protein